MPNPKNKSVLSDEQQDVVDAMMKQRVFVRAGAGTGKTFTMVEGIVQKLREHLSDESKKNSNFFDHVFMITFTNNAAAELKTRLRAKLLADEDEEVRKQADYVENAWVSTIHGLCSRILREYALEAGVDPQFEICSESQREILLREATHEVCKKYREHSVFKELFSFYGYESEGKHSSQTATDMGRKIAEKLSAALSPDELTWIPQNKDAVKSKITSRIQDLYAEWGELKRTYQEGAPSEKGINHLEESFERLEKLKPLLMQDAPAEILFAAILLLPSPNGNIFQKAELKPITHRIKELSRTLVYDVCYSTLFKRFEEPLLTLGVEIKGRFDAIKRDGALLDNDDLLEKCLAFLRLDAVKKNPSICHTFSLAIVDEFQDTNMQQLEIIKLLAKKEDALCFVGDAQQSIYRFRGGDLDLYNQVLEECRLHDQEKGAEDEASKGVKELTENFRSHEDVLSFVENTMDDSTVLPEFLSLRAHKKENHAKSKQAEQYVLNSDIWNGKRILVEQTLLEQGNKNKVIKLNCAQAARRIADMLSEAKQLAEEGRPSLLGRDIAVLTLTRKGINMMAEALRAEGLPSLRVNQDNQQVAEYDVIQQLLVALENPNNTEDGVLPLIVGPMFEVPENDLLIINNETPQISLSDFFYKTSSDIKRLCSHTLDPRTYRAFDVLYAIRSKLGTYGVSELVEYACRNSGWMARLAGEHPERTEKGGALYKAFSILRDFVDNEGYGVMHASSLFSAWRNDSKGRASLLNENGSDAITLETIYLSKGLQYPIVVVLGEDFYVKERKGKKLFTSSFDGKTYLALEPSLSERQWRHYVIPWLQNFFRNNRKLVKRYEAIHSLPAHKKGSSRFDDLERAFNKLKKGDTSKYADQLIPEEFDMEAARLEFGGTPSMGYLESYQCVQQIDDALNKAEQWRLLYVALTRAECGALLCLPQLVKDDDSADKKSSNDHPFVKHFCEKMGLLKTHNAQEYDFELDNLAIHIRKDKYLNTEINEISSETNKQQKAVALPGSRQLTVNTSADCELKVPPFKAYEENEMPLPKVPWRAMGDVGSYSSDAHQQALAESAENIKDDAIAAAVVGDGAGAGDGASVNAAAGDGAGAGDGAHADAGADALSELDHTLVDAPVPSPSETSDPSNLWQEKQNLIERVTGKDAFRFGTAFHALGELAALTRTEPTKEQIHAQAALNQLSAEDAGSLEKAVHAWWNSSLRKEVFALPHLRPEFPFFMEADPQSAHAYTRGFIDLLAFDGKKALVVDYKTGEQYLTEEEARARHQLQGEWYARALLNSGFDEVSVKFILVQNEKNGAPLVVDFGLQTKESLTTTSPCN